MLLKSESIIAKINDRFWHLKKKEQHEEALKAFTNEQNAEKNEYNAV